MHSRPITCIKGDVDKDMQMMLILPKTLTTLKFSGESNEIKRDVGMIINKLHYVELEIECF